ncbi:hypothetical protein CP880_03375 [Cutibacterium namnetense]|uniref:Uncharacterized protein n=1 Tax=Cutibacterium namnetense TaxID=1574624 RepID=A0ABX9IBH2_9ACTN|nr:hypothetical protein CP880_03375 [Cutibacterium namnetense]
MRKLHPPAAPPVTNKLYTFRFGGCINVPIRFCRAAERRALMVTRQLHPSIRIIRSKNQIHPSRNQGVAFTELRRRSNKISDLNNGYSIWHDHVIANTESIKNFIKHTQMPADIANHNEAHSETRLPTRCTP